MCLRSKQNVTITKVLTMVACFCMIFVCLGFCSSNKGLYLTAITEALGIKRSLFSINDSCRFITTAVANLFFGTLIQKFGAKKMVAAGFLCLIISTLIYANANHLAVFYLGGCFLGAGLSLTTTTMVSYLVNKWFQESRGTVSGVVLCANGLGGALAAQIITPIIYEDGNPFGYQNAYHLVALILLIVGVFVVFFIREPSGVQAENSEKKKKRGKKWTGISQAEAMRKPYFYAAAVCVFLTGAALQGINGIAAAHFNDAGLDAGFIATVLSVHSVILCGSKLIVGFSYDKLGLRVTLLICEISAVLSFLALALCGSNSLGIGCAFAWGILSALALPLETVMVPLIAADLFGEKEFAKLLGTFVSLNVAGYAFGTPIANLVYDSMGSYLPILYAIALIMLLVIISFQIILNAAEKTRRQLSMRVSSVEP